RPHHRRPQRAREGRGPGGAGRGLRRHLMEAGSAPLRGLQPISRRRRRSDRLGRAMLGAGTIVALIPLVLIVGYLLVKGLGAFSWDFFTTDPTGSCLGDPGGIKSAILGTLEMIGLATLFAVPVG